MGFDTIVANLVMPEVGTAQSQLVATTEEVIVTEEEYGDETSNPNSWVAVSTDRTIAE